MCLPRAACAEGTGFKAAFPQSHSGSRYGAADAVFATPLSLLTLLKEKRVRRILPCQGLPVERGSEKDPTDCVDSGDCRNVPACIWSNLHIGPGGLVVRARH